MSKLDTIPLGCIGNKKNELKILLPIIKKQITNDSIFVEPFCGSCIVSFNVLQTNTNVKIHVNDLDNLRIQFYKNMIDDNERKKLYELEQEVLEKGIDFYNEIVKGNKNDYLKYVVSKRIHTFRYGIFPLNKKIILKQISNNWINFFKCSKLTNKDYKEIFDEYRDNEHAFLYLDPPYRDSFNAGYNTYSKASHDEDLKIIDNTQIYLDFLDFLDNAKCKILFSINDCALTRYLYKDYIKETYNHKYSNSYKNIKNKNDSKTRKHTNILIITNFNNNI